MAADHGIADCGMRNAEWPQTVQAVHNVHNVHNCSQGDEAWKINSKGDKTMAKTISCKDVGMDCDFTARAETEEALMQQVAEHASSAHGVQQVPPEILDRVKAVIKDE
jgi:predicted small metal-binding protein